MLAIIAEHSQYIIIMIGNTACSSAFKFVAEMGMLTKEVSDLESAAVTFTAVRNSYPNEFEVELPMIQTAEEALHKKIGRGTFALIRAAYVYALDSAGQPVPEDPDKVLEEVTFLASIMPAVAPMVFVEGDSRASHSYKVEKNGLGIVALVCEQEDLGKWGSLQCINDGLYDYPALAVPFNDNLVSLAPVYYFDNYR